MMQLTYQLSGSGWADARVSNNSKCLDMVVSYLSNALGDMAAAALELLRGEREVQFSFQDEPGEHRWILSRGEQDSLHIRILWFRQNFQGNLRRGPLGVNVFTSECTVLDFVGQVSHVLQSILTSEGVDGYRQKWKSHDFPVETFAEIQKLLTPSNDDHAQPGDCTE